MGLEMEFEYKGAGFGIFVDQEVDSAQNSTPGQRRRGIYLD